MPYRFSGTRSPRIHRRSQSRPKTRCGSRAFTEGNQDDCRSSQCDHQHVPSIYLPTEAAMRFLYQWWLAIKLLHQRIWPAQPTYRQLGSSHVESYLFVWAIHNFRTAAKLVQRAADDQATAAIQAALTTFDQAVPDAKKLRNALAHFDEYALGEGNLQKNLPTSPFGIYSSMGDDFCLYVSLAPGEPVLKIEIDKAAAAASDLFRAVDHAIDPPRPIA
jgi:hypothetical protein